MFGLFKKKLAIEERDLPLVTQGVLYLLQRTDGLIHPDRARQIAGGAVLNARKIAERDFPGQADERGLGRRFLSTELGQKRLADGVQEDEIIQYWDQPMLLIVFNDQMEIGHFMAFMEQARKTSPQAPDSNLYKAYLCTNARFSMPEQFDLTAPPNQGLTANDRPIYPEIKARVEEWLATQGHMAQWHGLNSSSLNAYIRSQLKLA